LHILIFTVLGHLLLTTGTQHNAKGLTPSPPPPAQNYSKLHLLHVQNTEIK